MASAKTVFIGEVTQVAGVAAVVAGVVLSLHHWPTAAALIGGAVAFDVPCGRRRPRRPRGLEAVARHDDVDRRGERRAERRSRGFIASWRLGQRQGQRDWPSA